MQVRYQAAPHTEGDDYSHRVGIEGVQNGRALPFPRKLRAYPTSASRSRIWSNSSRTDGDRKSRDAWALSGP